MAENQIARFQDFLKMSILADQTYLVNTILQGDKQMLHFNELYNLKEYKLILSDGELAGSEAVIQEKEREVSKSLTEINVQLTITSSSTEIPKLEQQKQQLESDLAILEEAQSRNRYIYQWLLIPFWLAEELIGWGEVVFRPFGCNFWGVTCSNRDFNSKEATLLDIFEEINL